MAPAGLVPGPIHVSVVSDGGTSALTSADAFHYDSTGQTAQTITFGVLPDRAYGDADFDVAASASSGGTNLYSPRRCTES